MTEPVPTIVSLLAMRAEQQPCRVGYSFISDSGTEEPITYSELDGRARAIACLLTGLGLRGKRAILLYPSGIDYIVSLFGCLYAGLIAVPACPPDPLRPGRSLPRIAGILTDAEPSAVLTTAAIASGLPSLLGSLPGLSRLPVVTTADVPGEPSRAWEPPPADADSIALLQYTSGSISDPKGVVLTHRNLISNSEFNLRCFGHSPETRGLTWLPPYHDMGLIGGILQPLYAGFPVTLMAPSDFLRRPLRWLQEISRARATASGGPNFAYDLCVRRTTAEERSQLDLSSWRVAVNGSEPVRAETMDNFARAFEPAGFRPDAFHPCYGLAEATLIVTGGVPWSRRGVVSVDAVTLGHGTAIPAAPDSASRLLVSSGAGPREGRVVIADPGTHAECPPGQVGEIWISGDSVARSYWRRPLETEETFGARLAGTGEGPFLRSGDLGFMQDGQLFVTGRIKDLIIICGRNHYPQDIELTAERSSPALRPGCAAAFTVTDGGREQLVLAHELARQAGDADLGEVADAVRSAVAADHGIAIHIIVFVPPGGIPRTTSGKVQRRRCAAMFTGGYLAEVGRSAVSQPSWAPDVHLDRSVLLSAPPAKRPGLLQDYLSGLVATACGLDAAKVAADVPLSALGVDSCAAISIRHSVRAELGAPLSAADLAYASIADLAALVDSQLSAEASGAQAPGSVPGPAEADQGFVRVYHWVSGSRVPAAHPRSR